MEMSQWIKAARTHAKLTGEQLGDALGVGKANVSGWETAKHRASFVQMQTIASITGYPLPADAEQVEERQDAESGPISLEDNTDYPSIPLVRFKISAGVTGFAVEYIDEPAAPIVFQREWYRSRGFIPGKLYAIRVTGVSMVPGLWPADVVIVNTESTTPRDGQVFAINYEGELVVKRMVRDEGLWWLHSDNNDQTRFPRKRCHEDVFIIGEIVHKQSDHI